jgi:hypothetical protein
LKVQGRAEILALQLTQAQNQLAQAEQRILALEAPKTEPKEEEAKPWWKSLWSKLS